MQKTDARFTGAESGRKRGCSVLSMLKNKVNNQKRRWKGSVFIEYILLVTIVGIGVVVGLAVVREALVNELIDLANAINAINS